MAFGKTQEQKDEEARQKAAAAYAESPVGRAEAAKARGDLFFQIEIEINSVSGTSGLGSSTGRVRQHGGRPDVLGQIEDAGWRLEHVGYVFIETGSTSTNRAFGTGQGVVVKGFTQGIYLFRNTGS